MFFDNQKYFDFVDLCRSEGITIPIIPGLKPLATARQLSLLPQRFHIDIPEDLADAAMKAKSNEQVGEVGIEWSIAQCKELIERGAPVLHFYTMGKPDNIARIAREVF